MKRMGRLRKRHLSAAQEGSWAVSYGDMITLLLGFYIMYFSIDPPQKGNTSLTTSLMAALEKLDKDVAVEKVQAKSSQQKQEDQATSKKTEQKAQNLDGGNNIVDRIQAQEDSGNTKDMKAKTKLDGGAEGAVQNLMEMILPKEWVQQLNKTKMSAKTAGQEELAGQIPSKKAQTTTASKDGSPTGSASETPKAAGYRQDVTEIKALDAEATRIGDRVYIMFPKVSFFGSASTDMTPEGKQALERFGKAYMPFAGKALLNIVGFSDERPVKGKHRFRDNLELSVLRAVSAQRVAENIGIPLNRTRLMGHGINTKLIEGEEAVTSPERWALTRKIMLVIEPEVQ